MHSKGNAANFDAARKAAAELIRDAAQEYIDHETERAGIGKWLEVREYGKPNGGTGLGIALANGGNPACPIATLSEDLDMVLSAAVDDVGVAARQAARRVARRLLPRFGNDDKFLTLLQDRDFCAAHIRHRLYDAGVNWAWEYGKPRWQFLDLSVTYEFVYCDTINDNTMTMTVTNDMMDSWNATLEDLEDWAQGNERGIYTVKGLSTLLREMGYTGAADATPDRTYIIMARDGRLGASAILHPDILGIPADTMHRDWLIAPSSVHELIITEDVGQADKIRALVAEINADAGLTKREDILCNSVYRFKAEERKVEIAAF